MMGSRCCSALNYFQCGADAKNSKNCSSGNDCSSFLPSVTVLEQGGWEMSSLPINLWLEYQCRMSRGRGFQLDSRYLLAAVWHRQGEILLLRFRYSVFYHRSPLSSLPPSFRNGTHLILHRFPTLIFLLLLGYALGLPSTFCLLGVSQFLIYQTLLLVLGMERHMCF